MITASNWGWRHAGRRAWAVRHLDLSISPGERVLLLGASGSGKSTLLHALAGVLGSAEEGESEGSLLVDGRHPTRQKGRMALVQQDPESAVVLQRVGDDVAFGCENLQVPADQIWPRVRQALDEVGLDLPLSHPTSQLSGGQKQRLALAGALAMRSDVVLLDEPTANLDPVGIDEVRSAVGRLVADRRTTLVVVEHRVQIWADLVDRVVVLARGGGLLADGRPAEVFAQHREALLEAGIWVPGAPLPSGGAAGGVGPSAERGTLSLEIGTGNALLDRSKGAKSALGDDREAHSLSPALSTPALTTPALASPALSTHDLTIGRRPDQPLLSGLNLEIPAGTSTVITGPNGVGKSTLALTLAGLIAPVAGEVRAAERLRPPPRHRCRLGRARQADETSGNPHPIRWQSRDLLTRLGMVFQEPEHQFVTTTVSDEIAVGLRALDLPEAEIASRTDEVLELLRLTQLAKANPFSLSGGEKRRLSVGTVLATRPEVIVLDEPTFGQDRTTWANLVRLMQHALAEGRAVVSVTHDEAFLQVLGQHHIALRHPSEVLA